MSTRTPFRRHVRREPAMPLDQKVASFVSRNSRNGYYTKFSTISHKFEISEEVTWGVIGGLIDEGTLDSTHDLISGEIKLCGANMQQHIAESAPNRKRREDNNKTRNSARSFKGKEETSDKRRRTQDAVNKRSQNTTTRYHSNRSKSSSRSKMHTPRSTKDRSDHQSRK